MRKMTIEDFKNLQHGDKIFRIEEGLLHSFRFVGISPDYEEVYILTGESGLSHVNTGTFFRDIYHIGKYDSQYIAKEKIKYHEGKIEYFKKRINQPSMNIWALKGHEVKVTDKTINAGYDSDTSRVKDRLIIGDSYKVSHTRVGGSSTDVFLIDFPEIAFNTVNFVSITEQPKELNMAHEDWSKFFGDETKSDSKRR